MTPTADTGSSARTLGPADLAPRRAGVGLYDGGTLVYVTARPAGEDANEIERFEATAQEWTSLYAQP
ncbi:hypothetical protein [Streptomyces sp. NPDC048551]|uniref:hypothetical protein n=1 Tax=Streptomyces sp. NPDC048551 TaxID=3155758 RepID=UPI0034265E26